MEIIIGRDTKQSRLELTVNGQTSQAAKSGSVPTSVAAQHCQLTIDDDKMHLRNLDVNNYTYVNGLCVESKTISINDKIALGPDRYLLDWKILKPFIPTDISHLQKVWDDYETQTMELQIATGRFNSLRSATGLITMVAIALGVILGGKSVWYLVLYGIAIAVSLIFFVKSFRDSSKMPQKRQELNKRFQRDYVCPNCRRFMGNQSFEILAQNGICPYCKTKFIH